MKNRRYRVTVPAHVVEVPPLGVMVDKLDEANGTLAVDVEASDSTEALRFVNEVLQATAVSRSSSFKHPKSTE